VKQEHLDEITVIYDVLARHDVEALRSLRSVHTDFAWQPAPDELETDERRGIEKALAFSGEFLETFDRIDIDIEDRIDLGPEAAIFVINMRVRGAASGADTERREAHLWTVRDGQLASLREFPTLEDAMAAAG
jgi:ketosteroid isomerase-like protein